jgi:hypothetical protein
MAYVTAKVKIKQVKTSTIKSVRFTFKTSYENNGIARNLQRGGDKELGTQQSAAQRRRTAESAKRRRSSGGSVREGSPPPVKGVRGVAPDKILKFYILNCALGIF